MRFVPIDRVDQQIVLARGVPSERPDGVPLLRAGASVSSTLALRVAAAGVRGIWADDELGREIVPPPEFPADVIGIALHAVTRALEAAPGAIAAQRELDDKIVRGLQEAAGELADAVLSYPAEDCPISDVPVARATAPWHAVRVALLGAFIGRRALSKSGWIDYQGVQRFDGLDERLSTLAMGLLVHDIAVASAPGSAPELSGYMTLESEQDVEHVSAGVALFAPTSTPAALRAAIQSHHERWDGCGYPQHKCRDATAVNARIAAIADAFDSLVATGDGRLPLPVHAAVRAIDQGGGTRFDPLLVAHFAALVPPYPVGHELRLPDGRAAVVAQLPSGDRLRPTVRLRSAAGTIVELVADLAPVAVTTGLAA
jgi:HD-GYP domain-containing protein (c-di-GMP phosphodiesterase class II)